MGAELTRAQTPYLPFTPDEIADEAARCREAGAAVIHLHVRTDDGKNTQSTERFARGHRRDPPASATAIVQPSTGGAVGMSIDERTGPLACRPEMATLNCGTINFGDDVFVNSRPDIRKLAGAIRAAGALPELECYEVGHVEEALSLAAEGAIPSPLHFQFVLGVQGAIPARDDVVHYLRSLVPAGEHVGGRGRRTVAAADDRAGDAPRRPRARRARGQHLPGARACSPKAARRSSRAPRRTRGRSGASPSTPARARAMSLDYRRA